MERNGWLLLECVGGELVIEMALQILTTVGMACQQPCPWAVLSIIHPSELQTTGVQGLVGGPSLASPSMLVALCCQTSKEQEMTPQTWHLFKELGLKTSLEPVFYESTGENPFFIHSREKHRQSRCLGTKQLSWNWSFVALFDIGKNRGRLKKKMYSGNQGFWAQGDLCTLYIFCWFPQLSIFLRAEGAQVP